MRFFWVALFCLMRYMKRQSPSFCSALHFYKKNMPEPSQLADIQELITSYYNEHPDPAILQERVVFGTSGHRGSSLQRNFNEYHIWAIVQAICEYRVIHAITGPLFIGFDTHALSKPAFQSAIEVLAANGVQIRTAVNDAYTPTPVISHAILTFNQHRKSGLADGIVITPSHNPPEDGGIKYNPPKGGGAAASVTSWIEKRANEILEKGAAEVKRIPFEQARRSSAVCDHDFMNAYIEDLVHVIDMPAICLSGVRIGIDPMGGAGVEYWEPIAKRYGLNLTVINKTIDPTFRFVPPDWDGRIRMDPSSPHAMSKFIKLKDHFEIAAACDPDHDRHGIVVKSSGLLPPNHYLSAAIFYLCKHRTMWRETAAIGKTIVTSQMLNRVAARLHRPIFETPVGFKWFADGLFDGSLIFAGEQSAGGTFARKDGSVWTTDKDGIVMALLAAEMTARMQKDPGELYRDLTKDCGDPVSQTIEMLATAAQKEAVRKLSPQEIRFTHLAGEKITSILTHAPSNGAAIGGIKVISANGWFAIRPSGTENILKIYAESFLGDTHLAGILEEAQTLLRELGLNVDSLS
jgi:phosphoglucomutase